MSNTKEVQKALSLLGDAGFTANQSIPVEVIETDYQVLNHVVFGCGGLPRGRAIELFAPPSAGKTSLALWLMAQTQKRGGTVAFIDVEGTYSPSWAETFGVDNSQVIKPEFGSAEEALYYTKLLIASNLVDLIVMDSLAALMPTAMAEGATLKKIQKGEGAQGMNIKLERAKVLSAFCAELAGGFKVRDKKEKWVEDSVTGETFHRLKNKKTSLIMINHAKNKIGVMFGDPTTTPGGEGPKFLSSIRIGLEYSSKSKDKDEFGRPEYRVSNVSTPKNKLAPPEGKTKVRWYRDGGMSLHEADVEVEEEEWTEEDDKSLSSLVPAAVLGEDD